MESTRTISPAAMMARWTSADRPKLFKRKLIGFADGVVCRCAQGDALHCAGYSDKELFSLGVESGDMLTAKALGISVAHAILLRNQNDSLSGCPQDVLSHPERILGPHARSILAFWLRLDQMDVSTRWLASRVTDGPTERTWHAAVLAVGIAGAGAAEAANDTTWATLEIQGHEHLTEPLAYLPPFGIHAISDLQAEADAIVLGGDR